MSASHLDRGNADDGAAAAGEPVDGLAVTDVDGSLDLVFARFFAGVDGHQPKIRDAHLVEQAAERGMQIACVKLQSEHDVPIQIWRSCIRVFREEASFCLADWQIVDINVLGN